MANKSKQELLFDAIHWFQDESTKKGKPTEENISHIINKGKTNLNPPSSRERKCGMPYETDNKHPPYWTFSFEVNSKKGGLLIENIIAHDTQKKKSVEEVIEKIEFSEFYVEFDDKTKVDLDEAFFKRAFKNSRTKFFWGYSGYKDGNNLYQNGIKLQLTGNVFPNQSKEICWIELGISIVFSYANNDFDPGGIPVAMKLWPQVSFTWYNKLDGEEKTSTKKVAKFHVTTKLLCINSMYMDGHSNHNMTPNNVASFFTDNNNSMTDKERFKHYGVIVAIAKEIGMPLGWGMMFDYVYTDVKNQKTILGVHPKGNKKARNGVYNYKISNSNTVKLNVEKHERQGQYDNIHIHAGMGKDRYKNTDIHAPFCGHSCIHLHWRWSVHAVDGAASLGRNSRQYKGWSNNGKRNRVINAPLVPPNHEIKVKLVNPSAKLKKLWYETTVYSPNAKESEITFEHGLGWAYRYSLVTENEKAMIGTLYPYIFSKYVFTDDNSDRALPVIVFLLLSNAKKHLKELRKLNNHQLAEIFQKYIYPEWRYTDGKQQVPEGDFTGNNSVPMEDL